MCNCRTAGIRNTSPRFFAAMNSTTAYISETLDATRVLTTPHDLLNERVVTCNEVRTLDGTHSLTAPWAVNTTTHGAVDPVIRHMNDTTIFAYNHLEKHGDVSRLWIYIKCVQVEIYRQTLFRLCVNVTSHMGWGWQVMPMTTQARNIRHIDTKLIDCSEIFSFFLSFIIVLCVCSFKCWIYQLFFHSTTEN